MSGRLNRHQTKLILYGAWIFEKNAARARKGMIESGLNPVPSPATVRRFFAQFKRKELRFVDKPRSGRPITATTKSNQDIIKKLITEDDEITLKKLSQVTRIRRESIRRIIIRKLKVKKLRPVTNPAELSDAQKEERLNWCKRMVDYVPENKDSITTGDETYLFFEQKHSHAKKWTFGHQPTPRATKMNRYTTKKRMFFIFFNNKGLMHLDFMPLNHAATANNYAWQLQQVMYEWEKQGRNISELQIHDDNARIHNAAYIRNFYAEKGLKRMEHPRYSPDLAPNDFWLIRKVKRAMSGKKFVDEYAMYRFAKEFLMSIPQSEYERCYDEWIKRMYRCIEANGDYFEYKPRKLKPVVE